MRAIEQPVQKKEDGVQAQGNEMGAVEQRGIARREGFGGFLGELIANWREDAVEPYLSHD